MNKKLEYIIRKELYTETLANNSYYVSDLLKLPEIRKMKLLSKNIPLDCGIGGGMPEKELRLFKSLKHKIYIQRLLKNVNNETCEMILQHLPFVPSIWLDQNSFG